MDIAATTTVRHLMAAANTAAVPIPQGLSALALSIAGSGDHPQTRIALWTAVLSSPGADLNHRAAAMTGMLQDNPARAALAYLDTIYSCTSAQETCELLRAFVAEHCLGAYLSSILMAPSMPVDVLTHLAATASLSEAEAFIDAVSDGPLRATVVARWSTPDQPAHVHDSVISWLVVLAHRGELADVVVDAVRTPAILQHLVSHTFDEDRTYVELLGRDGSAWVQRLWAPLLADQESGKDWLIAHEAVMTDLLTTLDGQPLADLAKLVDAHSWVRTDMVDFTEALDDRIEFEHLDEILHPTVAHLRLRPLPAAADLVRSYADLDAEAWAQLTTVLSALEGTTKLSDVPTILAGICA